LPLTPVKQTLEHSNEAASGIDWFDHSINVTSQRNMTFK
jgi:hypothetical protein